MALQPSSDSASRQVTTFSQQGSLDWVALGQMQYTASIAVLGRLAGAGIDTLTVAFGQALCSSVPLGIHGEKVLHGAMKRLSSCSTFGDLVWFGVGVRHILRDLVQTSQGAALVALCAALAEGYAADVSALVLYEMSQSLGGPGELTPSLNQWSALVKVAGSVFKESTLGVRIGQLIKLSGLSRRRSLEADHPAELVQVILAVGKVLRKQTETVYIHGGPACSWIASWADFVLGLRVEVIAVNGDSIFVNYAKAVLTPEVVVTFTESANTGTEIQCTGSTMVVQSGRQFIREYLNLDEGFVGGRILKMSPLYFSGGRLSWNTMFLDAFGDDFACLLAASTVPSAAEHTDLHLSQPEGNVRTDAHTDEPRIAFARFIACKYHDIVTNTAVGHLHDSYLSFVSWLPDQLRELQSLKPFILDEARKLLTNQPETRRDIYLQQRNEQADALLRRVCNCSSTTRSERYCSRGPSHARQTRTFCLLNISRTILQLSYLLSYLELDTPLLPTLNGLHRIYEDQDDRDDRDGVKYNWRRMEHLDPWFDVAGLSPLSCFHDRRLVDFARLFGAEIKTVESRETAALSDGSIFCYTETLRGPTDEIRRAICVHVGAGSIQQGSRMYHEVSGRIRSDVERDYNVESIEETISTALLSQDTTSSDLSCKALVEDRAGRLAFWYRITCQKGAMTFSPIQLLNGLVRARTYLISHAVLGLGARDRNPDYTGFGYAVARGEGIVFRWPGDRFMLLRPLRSNVLGRCIALARSKNSVVLVQSDDELARFFAVWAAMKERWEIRERAMREASRCRSVLVSPFLHFELIS